MTCVIYYGTKECRGFHLTDRKQFGLQLPLLIMGVTGAKKSFYSDFFLFTKVLLYFPLTVTGLNKLS